MDPQDIRTLDAARQRVAQLVTALDSLRAELVTSNPLPPWESLQEKTNSVTFQLQQISTHLQKNTAFFASAHVYPLPSFPNRNHEAAIGQMLRKKLEPDVEKWIDKGLAKGKAIEEGDETRGVHSSRQLDEIWSWAAERAISGSSEIPWGIDYTLAERDEGAENVVTGIRRKLDDGMEEVDEDEEMEDEDEEGSGKKDPATAGTKEGGSAVAVKAPMPLDAVLRFMNTGQLPTNR